MSCLRHVPTFALLLAGMGSCGGADSCCSGAPAEPERPDLLMQPGKGNNGVKRFADARLNLEGHSNPRNPPGASTWAVVPFASFDDRERLLNVRDRLSARSHIWKKLPITQGSEVISERWCSPDVAKSACETGGEPTARGQHWLELGAYRDVARAPEASGLRLASTYLPRRGDWGIELSYLSGGPPTGGRNLAITFLRLSDHEIVEELPIGSRYQVFLWDVPCTVHSPGLPAVDRGEETRAVDNELALLLESPVSMRDAVWARLDELHDKVNRCFSERRAERCSAAPDSGANAGSTNGCPSATLDHEEQRELMQARAEISRRRELIDEHRFHLFTLLSEAVPVEILGD